MPVVCCCVAQLRCPPRPHGQACGVRPFVRSSSKHTQTRVQVSILLRVNRCHMCDGVAIRDSATYTRTSRLSFDVQATEPRGGRNGGASSGLHCVTALRHGMPGVCGFRLFSTCGISNSVLSITNFQCTARVRVPWLNRRANRRWICDWASNKQDTWSGARASR